MTAAELLTRRDQVHQELAENRRHLVGVLRHPDPELESAPIGDVLCWCEGLGEAMVTRILAASAIPWGRRLSLLSARDISMVCLQIKARHPETWERWKAALSERRSAA